MVMDKVLDSHPAGDHTLHVGRVDELWSCHGDPLVFFTGTFRALEIVREDAPWGVLETPGCPVARDFDPFDGTPQQFFARSRRETPVFWHDDIRTYMPTKYDDCRLLLGDRSATRVARMATEVGVPPLGPSSADERNSQVRGPGRLST